MNAHPTPPSERALEAAARLATPLRAHLRRWILVYAASIAWGLCVARHHSIGLNASASLPQSVFLIDRGVMPSRGELIAFRWSGAGPYPAGTTFIKRLAGLPGDVVSRRDTTFLVNGDIVGRAKPLSRRGEPLQPGPTGVIPPGRYYVQAPHPDSLDSRYQLTGWIRQDQVIGRAHALF